MAETDEVVNVAENKGKGGKPRSKFRRIMRRILWSLAAVIVLLVLVKVGVNIYIDSLPSLASRLNLPPDAVVLLVNADDAGLHPDANSAIIDAMRDGLVTSTTVMAPCPGFDDFVERSAGLGLDVGIHLTHTNEWKSWNWTPRLPADQVPGLYDERGFMHRDIFGVLCHASPRAVYREAVAQIEHARSRNLEFNHIDSHMGTMQYFPHYYFAYLLVAKKYDLPLRMPSRAFLSKCWMSVLSDIAIFWGLESPDALIMPKYSGYESVKDYYLELIPQLKPGVTEVYIHPSLATDAMRGITGSWNKRYQEYRVFYDDPEIRELLKKHQVYLIGYRHLFALQRGLPIPPPIAY